MSRSRGEAVEQQVEQYLVNQGLTPVMRNFSVRCGEIDLIMRDGNTLAFVEVRYRQRAGFGSAAESVDWRKQQKLSRSAALFLQQHPQYQSQACRFDVVACQPDNSGSLQIDWLKNAFDGCSN
ncbi:YraN family protein [Motiliproteus coralliicola]|uniref:UPF0102 protein DV711_08780 n=1 Tax=Motiliproteus coralliicola TaxID=2283196 RepID=A0A369WQ20_9GAMM|nr:YraN family protein [Motiliproteus coralliicola]RDE22666.1 YraN family protein [Motiliproteus coralliicola]